MDVTDENARLTDFGNATDGAADAGREGGDGGETPDRGVDAAGPGEEGTADPAGGTPAGEADAVDDPATATASWDPDGATCADCGAAVERRWRDGDALVCPECKAW